MNLRQIRIMVMVMGALAVTWPTGSALASQDIVDIPCSTAALLGAYTQAGEVATFNLASHCTYVLTGPALRVDDGFITIDGNDATLERSYMPGTPQYTMIKVVGDDGTLAVNNLNFRNATVAIENDEDLTVHGGTFSGNSTAILNSADAEVTGAKFIKNTNTAIKTGGFIAVTDCLFARNIGQNGGAIFDQDDVTVTDSTFRYNRATNEGGAIAAESPLTVSDSVFTANTAGATGGAIWGSAAVTGSIFRRNTAPQGGAIANTFYLSLSNSNVHNNTAAGFGGGLWNRGQADITHSYIKHNTAGIDGGGIYNTGPPGSPGAVALTASTVHTNTPNNCAPPNTVIGCTG